MFTSRVNLLTWQAERDWKLFSWHLFLALVRFCGSAQSFMTFEQMQMFSILSSSSLICLFSHDNPDFSDDGCYFQRQWKAGTHRARWWLGMGCCYWLFLHPRLRRRIRLFTRSSRRCPYEGDSYNWLHAMFTCVTSIRYVPLEANRLDWKRHVNN